MWSGDPGHEHPPYLSVEAATPAKSKELTPGSSRTSQNVVRRSPSYRPQVTAPNPRRRLVQRARAYELHRHRVQRTTNGDEDESFDDIAVRSRLRRQEKKNSTSDAKGQRQERWGHPAGFWPRTLCDDPLYEVQDRRARSGQIDGQVWDPYQSEVRLRCTSSDQVALCESRRTARVRRMVSGEIRPHRQDRSGGSIKAT